MDILDIAIALSQAKKYTDAAVSGYMPQYFTATLAASAWTANVQSIANSKITASGGIFLDSDDPLYASCNIRGTGQAAGVLTFTASTTPATDILVKIAVFG